MFRVDEDMSSTSLAVATARVSLYHRPSENFMMLAYETEQTDFRLFLIAYSKAG